jgi:hypothetical protein
VNEIEGRWETGVQRCWVQSCVFALTAKYRSLDRSQAGHIAGTTAHANDELVFSTLNDFHALPAERSVGLDGTGFDSL